MRPPHPDLLREMHHGRGMPIVAMAVELGVSYRRASKWMHDAGVEVRSLGGGGVHRQRLALENLNPDTDLRELAGGRE